ncbi:hypothetical protein CMI47_19165 [Candidatus Pacearchaeota archaeon]|nr:hypothetical protein [Candidatus Pacearchaeota archaeon]|tara:strand:- start:6026 stop:7618 length:1593 start_codon:yes stop_codon:yes gene_type:complete
MINIYKYIFPATIAVLSTSCIDYELLDSPDKIPDILVSPLSIDFGPLLSGNDVGTQKVTITNIGDDELSIDSIYLDSMTGVHSITTIHEKDLSPGSHTEFFVYYEPNTYSADTNTILIQSNDPEDRTVRIPVNGSGDAPVIDVEPSYYDFGNINVGCDDTLPVVISNIGNVDLEVSSINYFISHPVNLDINKNDQENGMFPWIISPGSSVEIFIDYLPLDNILDIGYLEISSNDPVTPVETVDQEGHGDYFAFALDSFEQKEDAMSDILFVIDNSCSMSSHQTNLKNNFDSFINVFSASGADYQIAFITTDNAEFVNNEIITPNTVDPISAVNNIIDTIGIHGSGIEKGLKYSYDATISGGDAGPGSTFIRNDARLVIIYVSDEPDASSNYSPGMTPSDYSSHILGLKQSNNLVIAHAVAGDYPSGCNGNGWAQFGDGYYDVVNDLGGTFISICSTDWGVQMDTLARDSISALSFSLSKTPVEDTIEVYVDGIESSEWSYDQSINSVTFRVIPPAGSNIEIAYAIYGECQ